MADGDAGMKDVSKDPKNRKDPGKAELQDA